MFSLDTIMVSSIVAKENYKKKMCFPYTTIVLAPSFMRYAICFYRNFWGSTTAATSSGSTFEDTL